MTPGPVAIGLARAALQRADLVKEMTGGGRGQTTVAYRYRSRLFGAETICALIRAGEAVRVGDVVRRVTA